MIELKFKDKEFMDAIKKGTAQGMMRAAQFLHEKCRAAVNKSNTHRETKKFSPKQQAARRGQKTGVVYENMHNAYAGQPPFKRTGTGQANIVWEFNGSMVDPRCRVGVRKNGLYMIYLELGTRKIAARPWLIAMLKRYKSQIARLILTGGKK
jgi:hypothetical protein